MRDPKTVFLDGFPQTKIRILQVAFNGRRLESIVVGKHSGSQFVKLPYQLLDSELWQKLSRPAKDVYISVRRMKWKRDVRGQPACTNWDFIPFGYSDLLGAMDKHTFVKAIQELRNANLIKLEIPGEFPRKKAIYSLPNYRS